MEMNTFCCTIVISLFNILLQTDKVWAKRDPQIYCGACTALIDEIRYVIETEDPRRKIDVGSFRIDPNGQRKHETIPYAGSETHLHEIVETVCDKMTDYAVKTDPETEKISYVRFQARGDEPLELEHISITAETGKKLKIACGNILEDYEDDIIAHFKAKTMNIHEELCDNIIGYCRPNKDEL
ncbi:protein canopy homolog 2-like [Apostichopus japonicus]|uniref:protein canopy homolog 2-like n=1 Tax=Stichopus japonicus TaxID=307972 RepID=UPI003AB84188